MKNFVQLGEILRLTAPYDRLSGQGALVGSIFGVATIDVLSGVVADFRITGVVDIAKATGAWTEGAAVYWDNTNKVATMSRLGPQIGIAVKNDSDAMAQSADATGRCRLDGPTLRIAYGEVTLDGTNPTPVAAAVTGLSTIVSAQASLKTATAPGDDPSWLTVDYAGSDGILNIYAWKNTGGTDPTLVASTNNTAVVCWLAIGT